MLAGLDNRADDPRAPTLLQTHLHDSQSQGGRDDASCLSLPADLQEKACTRLAQFALMMTILVIVVSMTSQGVWQTLSTPPQRLIIRVTQVITILLSLGLFLAARSHRLSPRTKLRLGLGYQISFCLVYSMGYNWFTVSAYNIFAAITMATLLIAVYPLIVPSPPRQMLFTSLAAAATAPLSVFVIACAGRAAHTFHDYLGVSIYPAICVVFAQFGSRVVYGLSKDVVRARELGSYHLEEKLGQGGMGEVWRARHRLLARPAAVKVIHREVLSRSTPDGGGSLTERFKREAKATAMLESPHTVSVFDFGVTEAGTFYLAMELLDGIDLQSLVAKYGPVPPERAIAILVQVCHSLAEAHEHGLIHRDIKPANIMVCGDRAGDYDFVKVLDFGLVAIRGDRRGSDPRLTAENRIIGTPAYMPPELVESDAIDYSADLYSLGCVAFWLLTGQTVFRADTTVAMAIAHFKEAPSAPSDVAEQAIPDELDQVVLACLAKAPEARPPSARELATRLAAIPHAAWTQERAKAWWDEQGLSTGGSRRATGTVPPPAAQG